MKAGVPEGRNAWGGDRPPHKEGQRVVRRGFTGSSVHPKAEKFLRCLIWGVLSHGDPVIYFEKGISPIACQQIQSNNVPFKPSPLPSLSISKPRREWSLEGEIPLSRDSKQLPVNWKRRCQSNSLPKLLPYCVHGAS